jgi:hypothetical protein
MQLHPESPWYSNSAIFISNALDIPKVFILDIGVATKEAGVFYGIEHHTPLASINPLSGKNFSHLGVRLPDMSSLYTTKLLDIFEGYC